MTDYATRDATVERRRELFDEAAAIIRAEYDQDLTVSVVAHRVAASRRGLQRAFRQAGATSFRTYLARVRMARAAQMLQSGSASVQTVAAAVGYRQPAQFAKAFRRHYGCTPTLFRAGQGPQVAERPNGSGNGASQSNGKANVALLVGQPVARSVT